MPSERDLDLIRASAAGDAERMRALLGRGAKVNARMKNGATPLLAAATTIRAAEPFVVTASNATANQLLVYSSDGELIQTLSTQGQGGASGNSGGTPRSNR